MKIETKDAFHCTVVYLSMGDLKLMLNKIINKKKEKLSEDDNYRLLKIKETIDRVDWDKEIILDFK